MTTLLLTVSIPYLRAHAGRILLTLLGVIIGVQGMVAMGALNHSIIKSFEAGLEAIAGSARLQIAGPETGIPDSLAEEALHVPGVQSAVAVVDGSLTSAEDTSLRIRTFGIDLLSMVGTRSPQFPREHVHIADELRFVNALDSIALGQPLLARLHAKVGDTVRLATPSGVRPYVIRGSLDNVGPTKLFGGMVALLDLPVAEDVFLSPGLTQTIYIEAKPDVEVDTLAAQLRAAIGDRARVERTEARGQQMDALLGSVRVALSLASLVTMIAAFFIIYETIAISVEQRRREIAIARSLGFTRRSVAGVFMLESLILGVLGAAGGVVGGYVLAYLSFATASAGVSGMYFVVGTGEVTLPFGPTATAAAIGMSVCVLAALVPATTAAREPTAQVLRGTLGAASSISYWKLLTAGAGVTVLALSILATNLRLDSAGAKISWIMFGHAMLILGTALLASPYILGWSRALAPLGHQSPLPLGLACEFFARRPKRIAAAASAIMVGYALVIVLGSVVLSITDTLGHWIEKTFGAALSIGMPPGLTSGFFESEIADRAAQLEGVATVERYRKGLHIFNGHPVILAAVDSKNRPDGQPLILIRSIQKPYIRLSEGTGAIISDSLAFRYDLDIGDAISIETPEGHRSFELVGIARDYTMDLGTIVIDIDTYQRLWQDKRLTYAHIWPSRGANLDNIRAAANRLVSDSPNVTIANNVEFRAEIDGRIRDLLKLLGSLQLFACGIAVLGVVTFLLSAVVDRRREIAALRSIGVSVAQIRSAIMLEGCLIGVAGSTLGLLAGIPAAYFMVTHSLTVAMGWSLGFRFPSYLAATTLIAVSVAATAASYFPARRITAEAILAGLQME